MALTKVTGGLISTTSNYEVGVITATKFVGPIEGGVTGVTTGSDKIKVIDESSDTTCFPLFATHSDGYLAAKSGSNLLFNSNTGALTATSFSGALTGNVNGNATGLSGTPSIVVKDITAEMVSVAGTMQYEDVVNVDATGIVTAGGGLVVPANKMVTISGDLNVDGKTDIDDLSVAGVSTFTGLTTFSDNIRIADSKKILLGDLAAGDCQFIHDGNDTFIQNKTGDLKIANNVAGDVGGNIIIQAMNGENSINCVHDAQVELSYNGTKRISTSGIGVTVTGTIDLDTISKSISDTALGLFVYDTSKDSDGGAWRKRTQHTSWYNETLGTATRGTRKEFPSIAVIVGTTTEVTIYDADDPNLPMWMVFTGLAGGVQNQTVLQYPGSNYLVKALNGILVIGQATGVDNYGNPIINFISEEIVRADPQASEGGVWAGGIADRNQSTGNGYVPQSGSTGYQIRDSRIRGIGMRVLHDAITDAKTQLPIPTIALASYAGVSVITANTAARSVYDILPSAGSSYNLSVFVDITESGHLIFEGDGSNGRSIFYMPIPTADDTSSTNDGSITDKVVLKPYTTTLGYPRFNEPLGTNEGVGQGIAMKGQDHALLSYGNSSNGGKVTLVKPIAAGNPEYGRVAFITRDYNTGWMVGGNRACFCAYKYKEPDGINYAKYAVDGGTNRLTSEDYDSGDTSFTIVDNAASNNGYINIDMRGLTVGQDYKITMTRSAHATLDSGYAHRVQHLNGSAHENSTEFPTWNNNTSSSHTVFGYFTAQSADDDDLILYANACTIAISNFSIVETNDMGDGMSTTDLTNGNGAFDSDTGWWTKNTWTIASGYATGGSGNDSIWRTHYGLCPGRTYCLSVNVLVLQNTSSLYVWLPHSYTQRPITHTGWNHRYFVADGTNDGMGITNLGSTTNRVDDIKIRLVDDDRSAGSAGGIFAFGNVTRTPVEEGAELAAYYMGGNLQHYLWQNYNADLDFTDEMSVMLWVKDWQASQDLLHRGPDTTRNSQTSFYLYCDGGYDYRFTLTSNGSGEQNFEIQLDRNLSGWQFLCFSLKSGTVKGYLNGIQQTLPNSSFSGTNIYSQATNRNGLYIGRGPVSAHFGGKLALLRFSSTAPHTNEVKRIYDDERKLFQKNAKCTLYGTSDDVNAIGYDSITDTFHMGTSSGRSDFRGLNRINNTTNSITTAISASNGVIAEE